MESHVKPNVILMRIFNSATNLGDREKSVRLCPYLGSMFPLWCTLSTFVSLFIGCLILWNFSLICRRGLLPQWIRGSDHPLQSFEITLTRSKSGNAILRPMTTMKYLRPFLLISLLIWSCPNQSTISMPYCSIFFLPYSSKTVLVWLPSNQCFWVVQGFIPSTNLATLFKLI